MGWILTAAIDEVVPASCVLELGHGAVHGGGNKEDNRNFHVDEVVFS